MNRLRSLFVGAAVLVFAAIVAEPVIASIKTQVAQIGVTIIVNVTPSPIAYAPRNAPSSMGTIAADMSLHLAPASLQRVFHADSLHFMGASKVLAQAQVQHGVLVQAEVTPNPNATMLYSNNGAVTLNAIAGTTTVYPCIFTVTVDNTTAWTLEEGLSNDFSSSFLGKDLGNNTYITSATPQPTATPYAVYADDSGVWTALANGNTLTTYCVTLTLTVPGTVTAGSYSTNAIYTLEAS